MDEEHAPATERPAGSTWIKPAVFGAVLIALFVAARMLDVEAALESARAWIGGLGMWGPVVFIGLYVVATVLMVPGAIPSLMAGGLFGALWGTVYASVGSTIGASLSFLSARHVARDTVGAWLAGKPGLARVDQLTLKHGALIVCLIRIVPLFPFNIVNYAFGLTRVSFWRYVLVSWICMLPGTFIYVAGTDAVLEALASGTIPWTLIALVGVVVAGLVVLGRWATERLRSTESDTEEDPSAAAALASAARIEEER